MLARGSVVLCVLRVDTRDSRVRVSCTVRWLVSTVSGQVCEGISGHHDGAFSDPQLFFTVETVPSVCTLCADEHATSCMRGHNDGVRVAIPYSSLALMVS
jgi:hypothetical protein